MKTFLCVLALAAVAAASADVHADRAEFVRWAGLHGRTHESAATLEHRFGVFRGNLDFVTRHMKEYAAGKHTYTVELNQFADMSNAEFRAQRNSYRHDSVLPTGQHTFRRLSNVAIPDSVDWRTKGVVTPVKDQGQCGSCWSFSTTGSMEGANALKTGKLVSLSEQQLVDCVLDGADNCNVGGQMTDGFAYAIKEGMESEKSYPYCACSGPPNQCRYNATKVVVKTITGYANITSGSEADLTAAIAAYPTVSVAVNAGTLSWQFYSTGILNDPSCAGGLNNLDHGVLAVGYGADSSGNAFYWVKNSWGASWGMDGYVQIARNAGDMCGIADAASYPTTN